MVYCQSRHRIRASGFPNRFIQCRRIKTMQTGQHRRLPDMQYGKERMAQKRIGLQVGSLLGGFNIDIVFAAAEVCRQKGHSLILFEGGRETDNPCQLQQKFIYQHISRRNIDSLIVTNCNFSSGYPAAGKQESTEEPVPRVYTMPMHGGESYVYAGCEQNYAALIEHLITVHGCRTFNIVSGPADNPDSIARLAICRDVCARHTITLDEERIFEGNFEEDSGNAAMEYFMQHSLLPTDCIICMNDDMATGVTEYALSHRMRIPQDFRLVGFDGIASTAFYEVPLTTLCVNVDGVGRRAAEYAAVLAEGGEIPRRTEIPSLLKYRRSCGCLPGTATRTDYKDADGKKVPFSGQRSSFLHAQYTSLEHGLFLIQRFSDTLSNTLSLKQALLPLKRELFALHVRACAVVLFDRKQNVLDPEQLSLPSRAQLLFSYEEGDDPGIRKVTDGSRFNPQQQMLPEHAFRQLPPLLIIRTLYHDNYICGYLAYAPGDLAKPLIDTVFSMMASLLNSALVFTEKEAIERHQSTMLEQLQQSNSRLSELSGTSLTDELTKLYNRRGIMNFGQQVIDLAVEMGNKGLVFYADMDGLKTINDTFGHDAGDLAIVTMGEILKKTFRTQDVVGRMGGDEFIIVATGISEDFIPRIQERIDKAADAWYTETRPLFHLSISFGAAPFSAAAGKDLESLLAQADRLLYKEKEKKHTRSSRVEKME